MPLELNALETRILGCLLEKERLTPENYPLSLNSLTAACNQSTNRDPVTAYDEKTVEEGLNALRDKKLAMVLFGAGSRVQKYRHRLPDHYALEPKEIGLICVLLLRGPQTLGELRTRTERFYGFPSLDTPSANASKIWRRREPPSSACSRSFPARKSSATSSDYPPRPSWKSGREKLRRPTRRPPGICGNAWTAWKSRSGIYKRNSSASARSWPPFASSSNDPARASTLFLTNSSVSSGSPLKRVKTVVVLPQRRRGIGESSRGTFLLHLLCGPPSPRSIPSSSPFASIRG